MRERPSSLEEVVTRMEQTPSPDAFMARAKILDSMLPDVGTRQLKDKQLAGRIAKLNERRINIMLNSLAAYIYDESQNVTRDDLANPNNFESSLTTNPAKNLEELSEIKLPMFVRHQILALENPDLRAIEMERWIFVAKEALNRNNIMVAKAIYTAFISLSKLMTNNLSAEAEATFSDLAHFFTFSDKAIMDNVEKTTAPALLSIAPYAAASRKLGGSIETRNLSIMAANDRIAVLKLELEKLSKDPRLTPTEVQEQSISMQNEIEEKKREIAKAETFIREAKQSHMEDCYKMYERQFVAHNYKTMIDQSEVSKDFRSSIQNSAELNDYLVAKRGFEIAKNKTTSFEGKAAFNNSELRKLQEERAKLVPHENDPAFKEQIELLDKQIVEKEKRRDEIKAELEKLAKLLETSVKVKGPVEKAEITNLDKYREQARSKLAKDGIQLVRAYVPDAKQKLMVYVSRLPNDEIGKRRKSQIASLMEKFSQLDQQYEIGTANNLSAKISLINNIMKELKSHHLTFGGVVKRILRQDTTINMMLSNLQKALSAELDLRKMKDVEESKKHKSMESEKPKTTHHMIASPTKEKEPLRMMGTYPTESHPDSLSTKVDDKKSHTEAMSPWDDNLEQILDDLINDIETSTRSEKTIQDDQVSITNVGKEKSIETTIIPEVRKYTQEDIIVTPGPTPQRGLYVDAKKNVDIPVQTTHANAKRAKEIELEQGLSSTTSLTKTLAKQTGKPMHTLLKKTSSQEVMPEANPEDQKDKKPKPTNQVTKVGSLIQMFESENVKNETSPKTSPYMKSPRRNG